ncbi:MAG: phosphatase PAP2 family protein [Candidatus Nealsonbacteria bacterium]|nr:phosphatase PAP2 family protein [Candidatus Nealsonbacteria bacterium]
MDYILFQKINSLAGKWAYLDATGIFFAKYLGYILAVLVFLLFWRKWKIIFQVFLAAIIARLGIVELIRWLWEGPRPFVENNVNLLLEHSDSGSFPSGHAAFSFALSTVVYFYNKKVGALAFAASFLISISRVFAGIHWPSDILAGALVGIFSGWLVKILLTSK